MLVGSGVTVLVKGVLEVPISVKVRVPTGRLWTFEGSPPVGVLEALTGSLPEGVPAKVLGALESSPPNGVLEALRGSLSGGVLEALRSSLPGVSAGEMEVLEGSSPAGEGVLEVLRGLLPEGVAAVLSARWMNTSEDIIHSRSDCHYYRYR